MIETERLRLRGWQSSDKARFAEITNTPRMMEHMGGVRPLAEVEAFIDKQIAMQAAHGLSMWAMEDKATRLLIGICGLRYGAYPNTPVSDELEIGWRVAESAWRKGYAREAAEASIAWGWQHTAHARIAAWTAQSNFASWGLMVRLGMIRRSDLDFDHPRFEERHPLRRQIAYAIDRPASDPMPA
jgi:RimJ/RimL family protein N-acetyltransferase